MAKGRSRRNRYKEKKANLNVRDVENKRNLPYEYEVYLWEQRNAFYEVGDIQTAHENIVEFVKNNLCGQYQIVRTVTSDKWKRGIVKVIRLGDESMLMMFLLCHRDAVRKIFRLVESPNVGAF